MQVLNLDLFNTLNYLKIDNNNMGIIVWVALIIQGVVGNLILSVSPSSSFVGDSSIITVNIKTSTAITSLGI